MKQSLEHLPPKKRRQLTAIAEVIRKEAEVEMVILFGSHARGDFVEDPRGDYFSDFDVLVIVKSRSLVDKYDLWSRIEQLAERIADPTELTIIVHDIRDVNEQLEKGFYFFSDIEKEGIMLYNSQQFQLAKAKKRTAEERREYAQKCFVDWFKSAKGFFRQYEYALADGENNIAAFDLHQATERFYHTVLLVFTAYKPKTHNLTDLGKMASDSSFALRNVFPCSTPDEDRLFKLLKHAYVDARYNSNYSITKGELQTIAHWVTDLRDRVETVCQERIKAIAAGQ